MKKKFLISTILVAMLIIALIPLARINATTYEAYLDSTDKYYVTAQQAINAAATNGGTVTLRTSIDYNITIPYGTVNINLNGFYITGHVTINGSLNVRGDGLIVPAEKTNQPANTYDLSNCTINGKIRIDKSLTYTYADLNATAYVVLPYNGDVNYTSNNSSVVASGRIVKNSENGEYLNTVIYNINGVGNTNTNIMTTDEKVNIAMNVTVVPVQLHVKTVNVANKVFDGNTKATINSLELEGFVREEEYTSGIDYTYVGTFDNANVETDKTVNIVITLNNDTLSKNYTINNYQAKANITNYVLTESNVTLETTEYTYSGSAKTPSVTVKVGNATLTYDTDYTYSYVNNTDVGTSESVPTVVVTGKGNYAGTVNKTFTILPKSLNAEEITLPEIEITYNKNEQKPDFVVKDGTKILVKGKDYTITYSNNVNAGTNATATVVGKGNYKGTVNKTFTILPKSLNAEEITLPEIEITYNKNEQKPDFVVKDGTTTLVKDKDYTITYSNNVNAGTNAVATVVGKGNYKGTVNKTFTINKKNINDSDIIANLSQNSYTYNGTDQRESVTSVKFGNLTLVKNTDYTVSYPLSDYVNAGTKTIRITAKDNTNYTGTKDVTFVINKARLASFLDDNSKIKAEYSNTLITKLPIKLPFKNNDLVTAISNNEGIVTVSNHRSDIVQIGNLYAYELEFNITGAGQTTAIINVAETDNYLSASKEVEVKITQAPIHFSATANNKVYDRSTLTTSKEVNFLDLVRDESLEKGVDYETVANFDTKEHGIEKDVAVKVTLLDTVKARNYVISNANDIYTTKANISKLGISNENTTINIPDYTYTGNKIVPQCEVKVGDVILVEDEDYTVLCKNNTNAGTAEVTITGIGSCYGTVNGTFTIKKKQLAKPTLKGTYTFNREIQEVDLDGFDSKTMSVAGNRKTNANQYTATVSLKDTDNYEWTDETIDDVAIAWEIKSKNIDSSSITIVPDLYTFDGENKNPTVTVKDGNAVLEENTEYTVTIENNKNAGKAKVTITGKGNYKGTKTAEFTIEQAELKIENTNITLENTVYDYDGNEKEPKVTVKHGTKTLEKDADYTVSYSNNVKSGVATVVVTGKGNYKGSQSKTFVINPKAVVLSTVKNVKTNKVQVNWEKDSYVDGYEVYMTTIKKDSKNMKAKAKVTLRKSTSTKSKALKTIPKNAKIQILKKNVKKADGYTWYKVKYNGKTGYVASNFLKDLYVEGTYSKIKTVKNNSTVNYNKKKLTKNKQYAFKVRSYKVIDGETYYGTYSNVKKVTIKK